MERMEAARKARTKLFGLHAEPIERICDHGEGIYLFDHTGKKYLDFSAVPMTCCIGYGNQKVAQAAAEQIRKLQLCWPWFWLNEREGELAERILKRVPLNLTRIQFLNSGSEATDSAIKLAYQYFLERGKPEKRIIISRWQGFHGSTLGALSVTGFTSRRSKFVSHLSLAHMIDAPLCYRCPYSLNYPDCEITCAHALDRLIKQIGSQYVAAFIAEPIGGAASGAMVPVPEYYPLIREICDKHDVLFIDDECICVFGRTGKWFGIDHWNIQPDIMTMAKGMSGGYTPMGAIAIDERIAQTFEKANARFFNAYSTGGNPVSCAIVKTVLDVIEEGGLVERNAGLGEYLHRQAKQKLSPHPSIGDIRGKGMLMGIELVRNKKTKETFAPALMAGTKVRRLAMDKGLIVYPSSGMEQGVRGDTLIIAPPYIITESEINMALDILDEAISDFEKALD
jgi:adenosylmethionine-8-amino-7-oxononanoate aminotransferase